MIATRKRLPIGRPQKIICVGLNYRDHAEEQGVALPERPLLFAKWPNTLIGPGDPIELPAISRQVDFEAELGVVIGATVSRCSKENALEAVAGYVCLNDVSARDLQFADGQWVRGKALDTFCPVGPRLVPKEEVGDPQSLRIRSVLNGETMQDSTTANMVFGVAELIAFISQAITLEPGDLIATGTPDGVGVFRDPQVFLEDGDEIVIAIEGVGEIANPVVAARSSG
jgi:2-keto-4-pentenoate hydratase/2-oxohepta-3-ene-1,7-dioic acid hydratase in catechol pathway